MTTYFFEKDVEQRPFLYMTTYFFEKDIGKGQVLRVTRYFREESAEQKAIFVCGNVFF